ncbi:aldolase, partial [Aspergillus karnatakaensis]|uniref:dihydrodipicolinate synthase family protein n=1 Tax=Aspergillus karnatakaensis TaxID=1810916 RepID=UPI003CCDB8CB
MPTPPRYGVYTPLVTFFNADESLDIPSTLTHATRMAAGGVAGLVLQGSNGEAPHLDHAERQLLVRSIRIHLNEQGYSNLQLIVGCGAPSVRETLVHITEAKESGADYALVLPPSYWAAAMSAAVIESFFEDVATSSPLPILIYNFPAVTSSLDITSDSIIRLAQHTPAIVGCKLTCGNLGKLTRVTSSLSRNSFSAFGGKSDFFLPALVAGSTGIIAALANIAPKVHVKLLELYNSGDLKAAQELQAKLSHADWALSKVGVVGVKAVIEHFFGYGSGRGRRPLGGKK